MSTQRRRITFRIQADPGSEVFVAGSFNGWNPGAHRLKYRNGAFRLNVLLPPGRHEYKFVVNDVWCVDPECPDWAPNEHGSLNSVLNVT